jgi:hypothetical protein
MLLLMPGSGVLQDVGGSSESLASGDLTTAFAIWLATKGVPKNEVVRAALTTHYAINGSRAVSTGSEL